jgi:hypothetical protein
MSAKATATTRKARQLAAYERALQAEPDLAAVVRVVDALCALVRPSDLLCHGCVWETIVKPLVSPLVGWRRGYPPEVAADPDSDKPSGFRMITGGEMLDAYRAHEATRVSATTDTEKWLRTSEAFDAFTNVLLDRLERADPANGHGIGRCPRSS